MSDEFRELFFSNPFRDHGGMDYTEGMDYDSLARAFGLDSDQAIDNIESPHQRLGAGGNSNSNEISGTPMNSSGSFSSSEEDDSGKSGKEKTDHQISKEMEEDHNYGGGESSKAA